jgi:hypothetical protein
MCWESVSAYRVFVGKSSEIDPVRCLGVGERIILKWSQRNRMGGRGLSC